MDKVMWYESLSDQLRWEFYLEIMKIVQPTPAELRLLSEENNGMGGGTPSTTSRGDE